MTGGLNCLSIFSKIAVACNHSLKESALVRCCSENFLERKIPEKEEEEERKGEKGWVWAGVAVPNLKLNLKKP